MPGWIFTFLFVPALVFAAEGSFKLDHRISLPGGEGWDCLSVDTSSHRLYVTRGNHVDIVDLKTEKLIGSISGNIDGAHAVAFVSGQNKGYITSGKTNTVVVFNLKTLEILKEIPTGKKPDIILFDETSSRVLSLNGSDKSVSVIDPKQDSVVGTIKLPGKPEFAVADKGQVFVNDEDRNEIHVLDIKSMKIKKTWPLKVCKSPSGLSADLIERKLFAVCDNEFMEVLDADSGKFVQTLPIGKNPDGSVFDSGTIFSSNGSGSLTVAYKTDSKGYAIMQELETQKGARTMTVDPSTHWVYSIAAKYEPGVPAPGARPKIITGTVEILVIRR